MRNEVSVELAPGQVFSVDLGQGPAMPSDQARQWLDQQFVQLECEPLRATGKLLLADKVLVIAQAAGAPLLGDPQWLAQFARAASAALARPAVRLDLGAMTISY